MKTKMKMYITTGCLMLLVVVLTMIHFTTRAKVPAGTITVEIDGESSCLALANLPTTQIMGEIVNGKGDVSTITGKGIYLKDLLALVGADDPNQVIAIADDEYSAVIEGDELAHGLEACLLIENGEGRLVIFGDPNSKRNVADIIRLVVK